MGIFGLEVWVSGSVFRVQFGEGKATRRGGEDCSNILWVGRILK